MSMRGMCPVWTFRLAPNSVISLSNYQDHRVENLVQIAVAALVLVTLGILLFQACHSQRRKQEHNDYI